MAHPDDTRRKVRAAMVFDQQTAEVAGLRYGIPIGTVRRWKAEAKTEGDDWDKAAAAQMMAGGAFEDVGRQMLGKMMQQAQATLDAVENNPEIGPAEQVKLLASMADSHHKITSALRKLLPETDKLAISMDTIRRLVDFVRENAPQHIGVISQIVGPFGEELARAYGNKQG